MKKLAVTLCFAAVTLGAIAQGTVNFRDLTFPISYRPGGQGTPAVVLPAGAPATYGFAVLTAPLGTTDTTQFVFSGIQGTNRNNAGLLDGPQGAAITGWVPGTSRSFIVVGWSDHATYPNFNPAWLTAPPMNYFGESMIGSGFAGGVDPVTGGPIPALNVFAAGGTAISQGFVLEQVPEPATFALAGLGAAALLIFRRRK